MTGSEIASLNGWEIAQRFGCRYSGDSSPVNGGFFYDPSTWEKRGYVAVLSFWRDPDDGDIVVVERGSVNKPKPDVMAAALRDYKEEDRSNIHTQIEASRIYCGVESDDWNAFSRFPIDDEEKLWEATKSDLAGLGWTPA